MFIDGLLFRKRGKKGILAAMQTLIIIIVVLLLIGIVAYAIYSGIISKVPKVQ